MKAPLVTFRFAKYYFCDMQKILVLTLFMFGGLLARAQVDTISSIVLLEAIEITAGDDFDPALFIERVKADTTYYKAFLNLRYYPHRSSGKLRVLSERWKR